MPVDAQEEAERLEYMEQLLAAAARLGGEEIDSHRIGPFSISSGVYAGSVPAQAISAPELMALRICSTRSPETITFIEQVTSYLTN